MESSERANEQKKAVCPADDRRTGQHHAVKVIDQTGHSVVNACGLLGWTSDLCEKTPPNGTRPSNIKDMLVRLRAGRSCQAGAGNVPPLKSNP